MLRDDPVRGHSEFAPKDGKHPSATTASTYSANGDANRFDRCMLLPSAANPVVPEARCVECVSQCDCNPGQFCYRYTGVETVNGIPQVVHEESRRRVGVCMKKDLNSTILHQPCRRQNNAGFATASITSAGYESFGLTGDVVSQRQNGPGICGEAVYVNGSHHTNERLNVTGQPLQWLWKGVCNIDGRCSECSGSPTFPPTQCGDEQVCLDGTWHRSLTIDQTIRTFHNDTRAGTLLAIVFLLLTMLVMACWTCCKRSPKKTAPAGGKEDLKSTSAYP